MRLRRRESFGRAGAAAFAAMLATVTGNAGCGEDNAIVGGTCATGYVDCNGQCVPVGQCGKVSPLTDPGHDAAAHDARAPDGGAKDSQAAADSRPSRDGASDVALGSHDGPVSDGGRVDGSGGDSAQSDARAGDSGSSDAGSGGHDGGHDSGIDAGVDSCAGPYITPAQCGGCGLACPAGDVCSPVLEGGVDAGGYFCVPLCASPYVDCGGTCMNVMGDDPLNCGACGHVCASGICTNGVCAGITSGDIVIIGHDYAASDILASEATVLANAVFLPPTNPLRVLSFEQYAAPSQVAHVKATLHHYAPLGRSITYTVANDYTAVSGELTTQSFDVLLVYDQAMAPSGTLGTVGTALATPISSFVAVGGDVVVLDGASGAAPDMTSFLSMSNVLQASAETPVPATDRLVVLEPGDAVGNFVISPYAPIAQTVTFTTSEQNGGEVHYVVVDETAGLAPVVIHKTGPSGM